MSWCKIVTMKMILRKKEKEVFTPEKLQARVGTVLGPGIHWVGDLHGTGGVRIEGTMQGDLVMKGLVIIAETGKVICPEIKAETVVVSGTVQGNITCQKLEIRSTGRVWGDVVAVSFSSEDGAFLRGQMRMEERIEISLKDEQAPDQPQISAVQNNLKESQPLEEVKGDITPTAVAPDQPQPEPEPAPKRSEPATPEKPKLRAPWGNQVN